jgi:hypothetical protein
MQESSNEKEIRTTIGSGGLEVNNGRLGGRKRIVNRWATVCKRSEDDRNGGVVVIFVRHAVGEREIVSNLASKGKQFGAELGGAVMARVLIALTEKLLKEGTTIKWDLTNVKGSSLSRKNVGGKLGRSGLFATGLTLFTA